jgi:hypothetical protein
MPSTTPFNLHINIYINNTSNYLIIPQLNNSHSNSNQQLSFPLNLHIGWIGNLGVVALGTLASKMESSFTYVQMYAHFFFKNCKTLRVCSSHGFLVLPRSIFNTIADPLNIYQTNGFVLEHFDFLVQDTF